MPLNLYQTALFNWTYLSFQTETSCLSWKSALELHDRCMQARPSDPSLHVSAGLPMCQVIVGANLYAFPTPELVKKHRPHAGVGQLTEGSYHS